MTVIKTIISVIHFISIAVLVLGSPFFVTEILLGENAAERFFNIFNPPLDFDTHRTIYGIFAFVVIARLIFFPLHQTKFTPNR